VETRLATQHHMRLQEIIHTPAAKVIVGPLRWDFVGRPAAYCSTFFGYTESHRTDSLDFRLQNITRL
jgi:hypothetical protein